MMALILVFASAAVGVSLMQSSSLNFQMAANSIQSNAVFQAAESVTEQALNNTDNINDSYDKGIDSSLTVNLTLDDFPQVEGSAEMRYMGSGVVPGSSAGLFEGLRFQVHGTASIDDQVRAGITQGALRTVPTP